MNPFLLLAGIVIGAGVFAATLWSTTQIFRAGGHLAKLHIACLTLTITAMATLQLTLKLPSQIIGGMLILAAIGAIILEQKWNRLLPFFQAAFGTALLAALPFTG